MHIGADVSVGRTRLRQICHEWCVRDEGHCTIGMRARTFARRLSFEKRSAVRLTPKQRSDGRFGFTIVEVMVVVAIIGVLAAAGGASIADTVRSGQAQDDAAIIANNIRLLRSQAMRQGLAAAMSVTNSGSTVQFAVVNPNNGCTDFVANPASATDLTTVHLSQSTAPTPASSVAPPAPVEEPPVIPAPTSGGGGGGGCFVAGTPVLTVAGLRPIESITVGDVVWSRDSMTEHEGFQPVAHTFVHEGHAVLDVHLLDDDVAEVISATAEHPGTSPPSVGSAPANSSKAT